VSGLNNLFENIITEAQTAGPPVERWRGQDNARTGIRLLQIVMLRYPTAPWIGLGIRPSYLLTNYFNILTYQTDKYKKSPHFMK
jgi:hypothetical protein